jgi:two-component system, chemotaxis family, response regulator Rcp1
MPPEPLMHILIVDDDETDRELFAEAAATAIHEVKVTEAANGLEAMRLLNGEALRPDLIVLDLNMPVMDGRETLRALKSNPALKAIPVCVLTTSSASMDVLTAYSEGANVFQVKPLKFAKFQEMISNLHTVFKNHNQ